ncbi:Peptidase inhibitor I78 family protein [Bordetella sputigena]|uniref:I78 family peptidase inhibitor n=1 Tax=Bordetella sputigena TaxID=1416810 RepID=UPI0039EED992
MIRKLIPLVLVASLAACANTGRQASSTDGDSTTSSTSSSSMDSSSGATGSGGYGGSGGSSGGAYDGSSYGGAGGGYSPSFSSGQDCDAQPVQNLIGTKLTPSVEAQIRQASTSSKTRVLKPGEVMTMEYDPKRINLILDQQGALTALRCG